MPRSVRRRPGQGVLQRERQPGDRHERERREDQRGDEDAPTDPWPVQREKDGHRRHRRQQVPARALAGDAVDDEEGEDPDPEQPLALAQLAAPAPGGDEERPERQHQEPRVQEETPARGSGR